MPQKPIHTSAVVLACLSVVAFVGWRAGAESAETRLVAQPTTIAIVDVERALNELEELSTLNKSLEANAKQRQENLDILRNENDSLKAELSELPTNAKERQREIRARIFELNETIKARFNAYQTLIDIEKGEIIGPLYTKLLAAVGEVSAREGYELVLFDDRALQVPEGVQAVVNDAIQQKSILYASDHLDITDQVVLLMNNKFQAGAD
ncbi:MAG: OmpH family outer membrane protein [Planctomycetota bacterium]|nr:OmpH family outer membrane protein [Planctomycetota bacterium]